MTSSIKYDTILTIDRKLRVNLHALSSGSVVLGLDQSLPAFSAGFHMDSSEARVLARALDEYADLADGKKQVAA